MSIDGKGDPNTSQEYQESIEALYSVAYKIKFTAKKEPGKDYAVMPLEGLWWAEDMRKFSLDAKSNWLWKAMIMQPDFITQKIFQKAVEEIKAKKNLPGLSKMPSRTDSHIYASDDTANPLTEPYVRISRIRLVGQTSCLCNV
ncbi:MAG: hypothetical protein AB1352_02770 [Patescibacteria group bacterium]